MCGSRPRICVVPSASSGTAPRSDSRKAFGNSSVGTRRRMDVSAEHMVEQARERFQLQDYYGAIHLLEEVDGPVVILQLEPLPGLLDHIDRKSTRLNSSH